MYKIVSTRETSMYPYTDILEAKIEITEECDHGMTPKYIYLCVNMDNIGNKADVTEIESWVHHYPITDMYDSSLFVCHMDNDEKNEVVKKVLELYGKH